MPKTLKLWARDEREYKNANNANNELIKYLTIYSVPLPATRGGDDRHNDCFYNSLLSILGDNKKLPKIINTAKQLKDYLKLDRDEKITYGHIEELEKAFPDNTSIHVKLKASLGYKYARMCQKMINRFKYLSFN